MQPLVFALVLYAAAQGLAAPRLAGTVVDPSGAPIPDATVRLETSGASGTTLDEVRTARDGRFEFTPSTGEPSQMSGDARLFVTAPGFAQATASVSSGSRETTATP